MTGAAPRDWAEYLAVAVFLRTVRLMPPAALPGLCRVLGTAAFDLVGYRRNVALSNLARHLRSGGLPSDALSCRGDHRRDHGRIGREAVQNFVMGLAEFTRLPLLDRDYISRHIAITGLANVDEVLREGRGAILVTGHFGSWEIPACVLSRMGYPVDLLVGLQRNRPVQNLMNGLRRSCGVGIVEPKQLIRAVRALRANRLVAMLSDQDAGRSGVFVDFLGEPASTPKGAARLALLTRSPIVPGVIVRTAGCDHRIVIEQPIWPPEKAGDQAVRDLTQAYTRVLESYVVRYPGQWLWTHRRWKTRPA